MTDAGDYNLIWLSGYRVAWNGMLQECLRQLGYDDPRARQAAWAVERERTVAALRNLCGQYGDNDWGDDADLTDVLDRHLYRHLAARG